MAYSETGVNTSVQLSESGSDLVVSQEWDETNHITYSDKWALMKKYTLLLIAVLMAGCYPASDKKAVLINIQSSGEMQLKPDSASITVNISCTNKDLPTSSACVSKNINFLFSVLEKNNISRDDYHSSRINLEKEHVWQNNSQIFNGYKSSSTVNILFKNLDIMSETVTALMSMEKAEISNLAYTHSDVESYTNKAYLKALDNSRVLADELRVKFNGSAVEVVQISNIGDQTFVTPPSGGMSANDGLARAMPSSLQVNPGMMILVKDIYVQYRVIF